MSIQGIGTSTVKYESKSKKTNSSTSTEQASVKESAGYSTEHSKTVSTDDSQDTAAVYEKNSSVNSKNKTYKRDDATIERMIAEVEKRTAQLRDLVHKMLRQQGQVVDEATDIYKLLREGKVEVDPETRAQAQKDIAEDGYWGVEQTSERMFSFAKALTGGDPAKADQMIEAVKKGYEEAEKAWGGELPGLCKDTMEATIKKLEAWRDQTEVSE